MASTNFVELSDSNVVRADQIAHVYVYGTTTFRLTAPDLVGEPFFIVKVKFIDGTTIDITPTYTTHEAATKKVRLLLRQLRVTSKATGIKK